MTTENRKWPLVVLTVFVVIAGAGVGVFFGLLAILPYNLSEAGPGLVPILGPILGGASGAGAGLLWSWLMGRLSPQASGGRIVLVGIGWGTVAGSLATVFLHSGLMIASGRLNGYPIMAVPFFGVPAGFATGLVCGFLRWAVVTWMRRKAQAESAATPTDGAATGPQEGPG
jgi:hypothetical protein